MPVLAPIHNIRTPLAFSERMPRRQSRVGPGNDIIDNPNSYMERPAKLVHSYRREQDGV